MTKSISADAEEQPSNIEKGDWLTAIPDSWEGIGSLHIVEYSDYRRWFQTPDTGAVEIWIDYCSPPSSPRFRVAEIGESVKIEIDDEPHKEPVEKELERVQNADEGSYNDDYERMLRSLLDYWEEFSSDVVREQKEFVESRFYGNEVHTHTGDKWEPRFNEHPEYSIPYPFDVEIREDSSVSKLQDFLVEEGVIVDSTVSVGVSG